VVEEIHSGQPGVNAALNAGVRHGLEAPPRSSRHPPPCTWCR
jgi:hypothetical protein